MRAGLKIADRRVKTRCLGLINNKEKSVDKPGSVVDNHSSGTNVTVCLKQPTRIPHGVRDDFAVTWIPIWSCSEWGFPCHACCQSRGALLPHHFTLTSKRGGIFSVALSVDSRLPGVTWHSALWSPDFPPFAKQRAIA
jgi:hypothetical protein